MYPNYAGVFQGNTMLQRQSEVGGSRFVFVELGGRPNLITPPVGGMISNPWVGKIYAGDLMEYAISTGTDGATVKILKTFECAIDTSAATDTTIYLVRDGYHHIPVVGDKIMKAPSTVSGTGKCYAITGVTATTQSSKAVWAVTIGTAIGALSAGDVLVLGATTGASASMYVTNPNCVAACDYDMLYAANNSSADGAKYFMTPVLHATMWKCRMSAVPACFDGINKSRVTNWFEI